MNTKQTNLFILLLLLAGIPPVVNAAEEESLARVLGKKVPEEELKKVALATEMALLTGLGGTPECSVIESFSRQLKTASPESKRTLLWRYSLLGNFSMVKCLVEANADLSAKNEDAWSALTLAIRNRNGEVVQYLCDQGVDVNVKGEAGRTALIEAYLNNQLNLVELLLGRGAEADAKDENGNTALFFATHLDINAELRERLWKEQDYLFTKKANETNSTKLECAVRFKDCPMAMHYEKTENNNGHTALMEAARQGDLRMVECLVAFRADCTARDQDRKTAEQYARENGHEDVANFFEKFAAAGNG